MLLILFTSAIPLNIEGYLIYGPGQGRLLLESGPTLLDSIILFL